jgi:carbon monoxide dehydrogenase subunit G
MARIQVKQELAVPADKLWNLVADFGNVPWIPGGDAVKLEGKGPGMLRIFAGPNGEIRERLESVDAGRKSLVYTIPQGVPFPVTGYRATMAVADAGKGKSTLTWTCECQPAGVSEAEASKMIEGMYGMMIGWIRDHLAKAG